jgi:hypothetical protein
MPLLKSLLAAILIAFAVPAKAQEACPATAKAMLRAEIYFGRNIGGHLGVSEKAWRRFVVRELTPRFPNGLTVLDGHGQWRGPSGAIVRESSKVVVLFIADSDAERERIRQATTAYKQRFKQRSVAVVTRVVCVTF